MTRITVAGNRWAAVAKLAGPLSGKGPKIRVLTTHPRQARELCGEGGVEFMKIEMNDPLALRVAFQDSDRVLLCTGGPDWPVRYDIALIDAAVRAGVPYLVNLSDGDGGEGRGRTALNGRSEIDEYLRGQPVLATRVHPVIEMNAVLTVAADFLSLGQWGGMAGNGRAGLVDGRDVADAVARVLLDGPAIHAGKVYHLTGPAPVTMGYIADFLAENLARRVIYHRRCAEDQRGVYLRAGLSSARIETLMQRDHMIRRGYFDFATGDTAGLIGRPARTVDDWLREHLIEFPVPFVDAQT
ncbi:NmrA family NAD(P)-binding protein [Martelella alba]|uniref:NmrA-like domain-containing protein n=1 Tax=Martelella alba TaxID=2590451 RepID=A0ABY2SH88_9HYPH|nr:NmrA family NAD(P)-binding protein [Martelella alba]TKI04654.1 hypothetical protein FCN80_16965 [Martelella alba]